MAEVMAPPPPTEPAAAVVLEPLQPHNDVKLFNRWSFEDISVYKPFFPSLIVLLLYSLKSHCLFCFSCDFFVWFLNLLLNEI